MSIQDISVSNSQKKHLLKAINNDDIAVLEDDSVIVHVASYLAAFPKKTESPVTMIISDVEFDRSAEFWVFS